MKTYRPVIVLWRDIITKVGFFTPEEADRIMPTLVLQRGFLYYKDKKRIKIVSAFTADGDVTDITIIPTSNVVKIFYRTNTEEVKKHMKKMEKED